MAKQITADQVKAIAETPGFGSAEKAARAMGFWDEHAAPDGKRRKYSVTITAMALATASVSVEARSKQEAEDKAFAMIDDHKEFSRIHWDYGDLDDFDVDDTETKITGGCDND